MLDLGRGRRWLVAAGARLGGAPPEEVGAMRKTLAWLYLAGGTIGGVSVALPHSAAANDVALLTNVGVAFAGGALLHALPDRLPGWFFHLALVAGTLLITRALHYSGDAASPYAFWYLWVGLYAFYFFATAEAGLHVALVGAAYGVLLYDDPGTGAVARWLTTVATLIVTGLVIDMFSRRLRRHVAEAAAIADNLATISRAVRDLSRRMQPGSMRPGLCDTALRIADASFVVLLEPAADGSALAVTATAGVDLEKRRVDFMEPGGAVRAFASREALFVADAVGDQRVNQDLVGETGAISCLFQPVIRDDRPIGVMVVAWRRSMTRMPENVATLIDLLAGEAAIALERADLHERLERMARTDELTGLPNRRAWHEELPRELGRARREEKPLSLVMLDLDGFKRFNDSLGHLAGDRLLKQVAAGWRSQLRVTDVLVRLGGDEFGLILPACGQQEALALVDRLRHAMPASQTCSAGVAPWRSRETVETLVARADSALYAAKSAGRDRVTVAE
jgi:diguanylate cyclase (GGDEF)-like protein